MKRFIILIVIAICIQEGIQQAFYPAPANQAVVPGMNMIFTCGTNSSVTIFWYNSTCYTQPPCPSNEQFYDGNTNPPRYSVTTTPNGAITDSNLLISPTEFTDAGFLVCRQQFNVTFFRQAVAQLIVIAANPMCNSNTASAVEGNQITTTCSVTTYGEFYPVMQFLNGNGQPITTGVSGPQTSGQVTSYTLTTTASVSPQNITCHTYFAQPSVSDPTAATNAPTYSNTAVCNLPNITEVTSPAASSQLSLILGLAIGLPLGVLCIIVIIIILVVCLRRRPSTPPPATSSAPANVSSRNGTKYTSHPGSASDSFDTNLIDNHHYDQISGTASYKVDTKLPDPHVATIYSNGR